MPGGNGTSWSAALALFDAFYRAGALVFGGGHVVLPLLQASLGTQMFWVVSLASIIPIFFLLAVRHEPTRHDIDDSHH